MPANPAVPRPISARTVSRSLSGYVCAFAARWIGVNRGGIAPPTSAEVLWGNVAVNTLLVPLQQKPDF